VPRTAFTNEREFRIAFRRSRHLSGELANRSIGPYENDLLPPDDVQYKTAVEQAPGKMPTMKIRIHRS